MEIKQLFEKDIDRNINGVIKVAQDDEALIQQELSEYVVTRELSRHFADFFENYAAAIDVPTDKMGVWITGFFGSGKSHFLKMLSYLLSNREVAGQRAIQYFDGKIEDPLVMESMRRAVGVPTEAILFNIDSKAGHWKEGAAARTALLRAFTRVFYEHLGFFGADFRVARLEAHVDAKGKTQQFRDAFARISGGDWLQDRESYTFYEDDIVEVLGEVMGMSEEAARRFFQQDEDEAIAPDALVGEIRKYVERRSAESGGDFRLLFMVDEVGQFIGEDVNLMLNLQTLVEELGAQCQGKVWVMVTSQEAIDKVVKVAGDDFSKIQGRFNTRLTLSSSSVDEVIKKRVLQKTPEAAALLEAAYQEKAPVLKNLFTFENSQSDLLGYADGDEFQQAYPFVSYQFKLMPKVFAEIRRHGNAGKHLASGERSMLSGFQESAQKVEHRDTTALVPLWHFYDTLAKSLDYEIRQVIDRAERAAEDGLGLQPQDVAVLKTLYLIHYLKDVAPTLGNISILMVDCMDADKIALRQQVKGSLERLQRENYIARYGDSYTFLTDEEQDVEREIKETPIDSSAVVEEIRKIVFDSICGAKRSHRLGNSDFAFDRYVDDGLYGQPQSGMKLNVITAAHELSSADEEVLKLRSADKALVVLRSDEDYYEVLQNAAKIKKYARMQSGQISDSKQAILKAKAKEAENASKEAQRILDAALANAMVFVNGRLLKPPCSRGADCLVFVLDELAEATYTKAKHIGAPVAGWADVKAILLGGYQLSLPGANDDALKDLELHLEAQARTHGATSVADLRRSFTGVPYGWSEADVAALVAQLVLDKKAVIEVGGQPLEPSDPRAFDALRGTGKNAEAAAVRKRERMGEEVLVPVRHLLKDLTNNIDVPADEDGLVAAVKDYVDGTADRLQQLLQHYAAQPAYPGKAVVQDGIRLMEGIKAEESNAHSLMQLFAARKNELLDFDEDFEPVQGFFPNQQRLFDEALHLVDRMRDEAEYLEAPEAEAALGQVQDVLAMDSPYGRVKDLSGLMAKVRSAHEAVLQRRRRALLDHWEEVQAELLDYAQQKGQAEAFTDAVKRAVTQRKEDAAKADTINRIEALESQLGQYRDNTVVAIEEAVERHEAQAAAEASVAGAPSRPASAAPAPAPQPKTKELRRADVCPPTKLTSEADVDQYVEKIRHALLEALRENGAVRLKG
ncbi:BREX system P-loop protein BrxC [Parvibacter caecicola]|uniref:BREX system P-loop protein BrxC n=1 Tax=Parvibacter caecicola TaxID=747645 RepID=A0A4V5KJN4_9ACTN|nr:BREX system P-loop protein BrxC [Parvibacter caecicola]TJW09728.1 BREX system P-loop protein BrxC [Parvibacter caecicola]